MNPATEWTAESSWNWTADQAGTSQITVQVRDGKHAGPEGSDSNMSAEFTLTAPVPEPAAEIVSCSRRIKLRRYPVTDTGSAQSL